MAIQPEHCFNIFEGYKTKELRKTFPKIETPFRVHVYCTKNGTAHLIPPEWRGKVIGSFICDGYEKYKTEFYIESQSRLKYLGKIYEDIRKVYIDEDGEEEFFLETSNERLNPNDCRLCNDACLNFDDIKNYIGNGDNEFHTWNITEPKLYDKPKELGEFYKGCNRNANCYYCRKAEFYGGKCNGMVTRPPQSYMYVEPLVIE